MRLPAFIVAACVLSPLTASAGKLQTVATLPANPDGATPSAAMTFFNGAVYGVTSAGGAKAAGTIFQLDPGSGQETVVYTFSGGADGGEPSTALTSFNGKLYGTTVAGGINDQGTVFSFDPATGTQTVLYSFSPGSPQPDSSLTEFGNLLYGTTLLGGAQGAGSVYSIDPATGAETTVYSFSNGPEGQLPTGGVVAYDGKLYGLTEGSGKNLNTLYRLDPATGQAAALYTFSNADGVANLYAGLIISGGVFYGTTQNGGAGAGTVFAFDPKSLDFSTIYTFKNNYADGYAPLAGLLAANGLLYGTTYVGGEGLGTVFSVDPTSGAEVTLHSFIGPDGGYPIAALIDVGGVLLGTTTQGGREDVGVAFSVDPNSGQEAVLHSFTGDFYSSNSALVSFQGALYGTTRLGGAAAFGSIFKVDPQTGAEQTVYSFTGGSDGADPVAALVMLEGVLYGTTEGGGLDGGGTLFSFAPSTGALNVHVNFASTSLGFSTSVLTNVSGILYGTTYSAASNYGTLFAFDLSSNAITPLHAFTEDTYDYLQSGVIGVDGVLYGTTEGGGTNHVGTVFSYAVASRAFSTLYNFLGGGDGAQPVSGLVYANGELYGSTPDYHRTDPSTLYKVDPASGVHTVVYQFPKGQGFSLSTLTAVGDVLYGSTQDRHPKYGELFRLDSITQQFTTIYKFKGGTDGGDPDSSLLSVGKYLYGTTQSVTTTNGGTVFRIHQ